MKKHGKLLRYVAIALFLVALSVGFTAAGFDTFNEAYFTVGIKNNQLRSIGFYFDVLCRNKTRDEKESARTWLEKTMNDTMHPACILFWFSMLQDDYFHLKNYSPIVQSEMRQNIVYWACVVMWIVMRDAYIMGQQVVASLIKTKVFTDLFFHFYDHEAILNEIIQKQLINACNNLRNFEQNDKVWTSPEWITLVTLSCTFHGIGSASQHLEFVDAQQSLKPCGMEHQQIMTIQNNILNNGSHEIMQDFQIAQRSMFYKVAVYGSHEIMQDFQIAQRSRWQCNVL